MHIEYNRYMMIKKQRKKSFIKYINTFILKIIIYDDICILNRVQKFLKI